MELISKLTVTGAANIDVGFNPYTFYTANNNYMKIELAHDFLTQASTYAGYLYATFTNWFSFENGTGGSYFNFANTIGVIRTSELPSIATTNGVTNPITIVLNNGSATATQDTHTATRAYSGSMPNDTVRFYRTSASEDYSGEFYGFKVYGAGDVLAHHYVGFDDGVDVGIEDLVTGDKYTPTGSNYTIDCVEYTPPTPTAGSKIYLGSTNLGTGKIRLGANDVSAIYLGTSLLYPPTTPPTPTGDYLCFTVETAPFTFNLMGDGNAVVYYSTDKTNWNLLNNYSNVTLQNVGDKVYFYGNNPNGFSYSQSNFDVFNTSAGSYSVSGNIMSLIDISCPSTIPNSYCFVSLFSDTSIVSAEHLLLPAQTLTDYCYFDMFARSTLSTPPELQATTLAESCYAFMFDDTDITESPILAVGILPQGCYYRMFRNCSNLNTVTCLATDITAQYCTQNWLENVAATGTFTKSPNMSNWTTGSDGIPTGWTVVDAQ